MFQLPPGQLPKGMTMEDLSQGSRPGAPEPFPGTVSTRTGSIVARSESSAPGIAQIDSDSRRPDAIGTGSTKGRGKAMAAMGFSQAVDNSEGGLINVFFPLIGVAFGIGEGMLGLLSAISKFARMIFGPFWAMLADKYGRKKILILVTGVWGLWTVATGFAPRTSPGC